LLAINNINLSFIHCLLAINNINLSFIHCLLSTTSISHSFIACLLSTTSISHSFIACLLSTTSISPVCYHQQCYVSFHHRCCAAVSSLRYALLSYGAAWPVIRSTSIDGSTSSYSSAAALLPLSTRRDRHRSLHQLPLLLDHRPPTTRRHCCRCRRSCQLHLCLFLSTPHRRRAPRHRPPRRRRRQARTMKRRL